MCAVEWKKLGDVCKIMNGKDYKSLNDGNIPVYGSGGIMTYVDTFVYNRPSVLLPRKGSLNNVFYVDKPFWTVDTIYWTNINEGIITPKYFFYYMDMQDLEKLNVASGAVPSLTQTILNKINIPIPSLAKQQEIVSHLDTFTTLISNLESELDMRRKQYEHYRNQLLDFEGVEGVEWKSISDVATNYTGLTYKPANVSEYGTLVLRSSNINEDTLSFLDNVFVQMDIPSRATVKENDILICVRNGSKKLVGKAAMITKEAEGMAFGAFMTILRATSIDTKFLFHLWHSYNVKKQYKGDDAMPIAQITSKDFKRIIIPVPLLAIQREIVSKLDAFENLIQSLDQEIKLRQKQYEYYREKLLTFEKE